jgi:hypothetical protein
MIVQIHNGSRYQKLLFLNNASHKVNAKNICRVECSDEEYFRLCEVPELTVTIVPEERPCIELPREAPALAVSSIDDEAFVLQLFGLQEQVKILLSRVEALEQRDTLTQSVYEEIRNLKSSLVTFKEAQHTFTGKSISPLLNVASNPKESRRGMFEKLVETNQEIRRG